MKPELRPFPESDIILVVPCYNEALRLNSQAFDSWAEGRNFILFVDDGSSDNTVEVIKQLEIKNANIALLQIPFNVGKGEAVRRGFENLMLTRPKNNFWLGFWDADLSAPLSEVEPMLLYLEIFHPFAKSVWGSRVRRLGADIQRNGRRHLLGRIFATLVGFLFNCRTYDTQTGAKIFHSSVAKKLFSTPFISRWIFDVEILLRMAPRELVEYPLSSWKEVPGSKINLLKDSFRVGSDIFSIWRNNRG